MAELTVLLLGFCAVLALFFHYYTSGPKAARPGQPRDLEDVFIELKEKALAGDTGGDEHAYRRLLNHVDRVVEQILDRHVKFVLDVELKHADVRPALGGQGFDQAALREINLQSVAPEVLLYLCFFLYLGGKARDLGRVQSDPESMLRILAYLVGERAYPPAQFFLGFVTKYGVRADLPGNLREAKRLLLLAREYGIGAADIELQHLARYKPLRRVKRAKPVPTVAAGEPAA